MRFSIVITFHNQLRFVRAAVDSALSQPIGDKEVIVVDDGSTDGSRELLEQYGQAIRLVVLQENRGPIEARNSGAAVAHGEYLVFLDGDDALMPWALLVYERLIAARRPMLILALTCWVTESIPSVTADAAPSSIEFVEYDAPMRKDRPAGLSASAFIVERSAFERAGRWTLGIFHLDLQDLVTKLGYAGRLILILSPATAFYRIHSANSIHNVSPFLRNLHRLLEKERTGQYPGGPAHRFERYAWFGGLVVFWIQRAVRARLFTGALRLVADGWPMILAGVTRRSFARLRGRCPVQTLELACEAHHVR